MSHKFLISSIITAIIILALSLSFLSSPSLAEVAASIIVSPTEGLVTDENGGFDSFSITLDGPPTHPVKITLETSDPTEGTVSSSSVTLNKNNWNTPKEILVIGLADGIQDGDIDYGITVESSEFNYGWNQIFARADDEAGNLSEFKHIWLYRMAAIYLPLVER